MLHSRLVLLFAALFTTPLVAQYTPSATEMDLAVEQGIRMGTYPAAVVVVGRRDTVLYAKGYGHFTWSNGTSRPDPRTSLWDIASLSKVVATASTVASLVQRGQLDLEAPVSRYLPGFNGTAKDQVTVRMLLDHTSGLPAYSAIHRGQPTLSAARGKVLAVPLSRTPGSAALYSDLNAMLAAMVVEQAAGERFEVVSRREVFEPLGMTTTLWQVPAIDQTRAVPTGVFRGRSMGGVVNDMNARSLGGVAGHAGVFSTGLDLGRFAQSWLHALADSQTSRWLTNTTAHSFSARGLATGTRALGWDTPKLVTEDGGPPLYGRCATATTLGHTGWTGTLLWLDPASDVFLVFLTNRSYAPRNETRSFDQMRTIRASVSDAARRMVGRGC